MEVSQNPVNLQVNVETAISTTPTNHTPSGIAASDIEVENYDRPAQEVRKPDVDDEDDEDDILFEDSTHGFLVYYKDHQSCSKLVVSIFVMAVQIILYLVILADALKGISGDDFTIPVKVRFGRGCNKFDNLVCPPELPNMGYTTLAGCILAFFLMHDMIAGIRILCSHSGCHAKIGGLIVLIEALMAALCGTLFALSANEGYDAIANCIGVLFIHDVDEKAYEAFKTIKLDKFCKLKKRCCAKMGAPPSIIFIGLFLVIVFSMSLGGIIRGVQLANIKSEYGEQYATKYFSDSFSSYAYDWSDGADYNGQSYWDGVAGAEDDGSSGGSYSDGGSYGGSDNGGSYGDGGGYDSNNGGSYGDSGDNGGYDSDNGGSYGGGLDSNTGGSYGGDSDNGGSYGGDDGGYDGGYDDGYGRR